MREHSLALLKYVRRDAMLSGEHLNRVQDILATLKMNRVLCFSRVLQDDGRLKISCLVPRELVSACRPGGLIFEVLNA